MDSMRDFLLEKRRQQEADTLRESGKLYDEECIHLLAPTDQSLVEEGSMDFMDLETVVCGTSDGCSDPRLLRMCCHSYKTNRTGYARRIQVIPNTLTCNIIKT